LLTHKIVTMKLSDLAAAPYNPRKISPKALKGLQASLSEFGVVQPVVWNKRTKRLVGGHQRVQALKASGETHVPVVVVDLDERKEKTLNITLNNPTIEGEFTDELEALLLDINKNLPALYRNLRMDALEAKEVKTRSQKGDIEFTEELMESHNYVVLYFDNDIDWQQLQTLYPLPSVKALDSKKGFEKIGIGRVVRGTDFLKKVAHV
jgi:ParB/Sulfiredoxin domain